MNQAVVTMVEGDISPDRVESFLAELPSDTNLPPFLIGVTVAKESGSNRWRIITTWRSREALESYRESVDTPTAFVAFRAAGTEPNLTIWEAERVLHGPS